MAISKPTFNHKVYWRSYEEYEQVRIRARTLGLGNNISAYIRDCVIADIRLNSINLPPTTRQLPPDFQLPTDQKVVEFEGQTVPISDLPPDMDLSDREEDLGSLAERMGLFDEEIIDEEIEKKIDEETKEEK